MLSDNVIVAYFFSSMFLSLKFIHSVLSSAPGPEGHCLPISDLSVRLFPGSLICHELSHVLFDGILGPCNASHLPTHSKCKRTHFLRAAICTGSFYSKVHNHLAVLCYLNSSVSSFLLLLFFLSFFFFFGKLGHRCFMAAKCFETFSYDQWEKMPLQNSC